MKSRVRLISSFAALCAPIIFDPFAPSDALLYIEQPDWPELMRRHLLAAQRFVGSLPGAKFNAILA
jgi:hypothetical protein